MKNLAVDRNDLLFEMPMSTLMLWARQDQYIVDDRGMTLGDKEMIDRMNERKKSS